MATNPNMSGSRAARERSILTRLTELQTSIDAVNDTFGSQLLHVQDEKAQNTAGGTFTSGAWQTRDLNTVKTNEVTGASLASNQITLPAGTFYIETSAPAFACDNHQTRLQDTTGAATLITGTSERTAPTSSDSVTRSFTAGRFTLSVESVLELQHRCTTTRATNGFGVAVNLTTEIYSIVKIWKVG